MVTQEQIESNEERFRNQESKSFNPKSSIKILRTKSQRLCFSLALVWLGLLIAALIHEGMELIPIFLIIGAVIVTGNWIFSGED